VHSAIPFYVVAFNRIKGLQMAVEFVKRSTIPIELVVLDMGSTWEPYLKYRESLNVKVHSFPFGMGPRDLWVTGELAKLGNGGFFLSDGDIDYSEVAEDAAQKMIELSEKYPWIPKVGLALRITDLPDDFEGNRLREWGKIDWKVPWAKEVFLTGLDTTTAYYPRREKTFYYRPALRIAGKFQAVHYPWYERAQNYDDEAKFYTGLASVNISSAQAGLIPNRTFKIRRQIWILIYRTLRKPLRSRFFGKICVQILAYRGKITELSP
jgi:hypothetical protein